MVTEARELQLSKAPTGAPARAIDLNGEVPVIAGASQIGKRDGLDDVGGQAVLGGNDGIACNRFGQHGQGVSRR